MTQAIFALVDPATGKIDPAIVPSQGASLPPGGAAGQVLTKASSADGDAAWVDAPSAGGGSGGSGSTLQYFEWAFTGQLTISTSRLIHMAPPGGIVPTRATAVLGTLPTVGTNTPVTARILVNGSPLVTISIGDGQRSTASLVFGSDLPQILTEDLLEVQVTGFPNSSPMRAGDLVVKLWWRYP